VGAAFYETIEHPLQVPHGPGLGADAEVGLGHAVVNGDARRRLGEVDGVGRLVDHRRSSPVGGGGVRPAGWARSSEQLMKNVARRSGPRHTGPDSWPAGTRLMRPR